MLCKKQAQLYRESIDCGQVVLECSVQQKIQRAEACQTSHKKKCRKENCDICQKEFSNGDLLKRHKKSHVKGLSCQICGKEFGLQQALKRHQLSHEKATLPCNMCNKLFKTNSNLNRHKKTH